MPIDIGAKQVFKLSEVAKSIQKTLSARYSSSYWVLAEINKLNFYPHSGHAYPELVEKDNGKITAEFRGLLWKDDFISISRRFFYTVKEELKDGIKVLVQVRIQYDLQYGISLRIIDIEPSYTLGDLEREKQESIEKLKRIGKLNLNKSLSFPLLPKRIALISVETSKGYADFMEVINQNTFGFNFDILLFPAVLQGEKAISSIAKQLDRILKIKQYFDVVAIIRGGGADVGLSCYNHYDLALKIAEFPLPVLTGIGHATNETVCELVAWQNFITPTRVAEWLINQFRNFNEQLQVAETIIYQVSQQLLTHERHELNQLSRLFKQIGQYTFSSQGAQLLQKQSEMLLLSKNTLSRQHKLLSYETQNIYKLINWEMAKRQQTLLTKAEMIQVYAKQHHRKEFEQLLEIKRRLPSLSKRIIIPLTEVLHRMQNQMKQADINRMELEWKLIQNLEEKTKMMDPMKVLQRGYSISTYKGKVINKDNMPETAAEIVTQLDRLYIRSKVLSTHTDHHKDEN